MLTVFCIVVISTGDPLKFSPEGAGTARERQAQVSLVPLEGKKQDRFDVFIEETRKRKRNTLTLPIVSIVVPLFGYPVLWLGTYNRDFG